MKKLCLLAATVVLLSQGFAAFAQEAPAPHRSPRVAVNRQDLAISKPSVAPSSTVQGLAYVIDSEKLHIGDIDVRLFGVVPPQLSASYGPQARAVLDKLVTGQPISCLIRDRDQAGRFLATCRTAGNTDLAMELLRRGLAVTARGSLASTDLAQPYLAAEQAAEAQKIGLWSGVTATPTAAAPAPVITPQPTAQAAIMPPPAPPATAPTAVTDAKKDDRTAQSIIADVKAAATPVAASSLMSESDDSYAVADAPISFFARYQIFFTGLIMLATALSILGVITYQRRQDKRDEMKAIAAALRGELTAARGVCLTRLKSGEDEKVMIWPRIRVTLYQAYVGRLGFLGAELARQIASIYGQASDYAAYYSNDDDSKVATTPKRQALQTLIQHIDEVLPRLTVIEQTGHRSHVTGAAFTKLPPVPTMPVRKSITTVAPVPSSTSPAPDVSDVATETAAASEVTSPSASHPIWDTMRKFARERFTEPKTDTHSGEQDYAALIEEEMANLTFGETEEDNDLSAAKIAKMRSRGT